MTTSFDALLFDIDNVLIDTRASYLAAIQKTVELYLNRPGIVSLKEIDQFKLLGGFNDDWDCCYGLLAFLKTASQERPVTIVQLRRFCPERPLGIEGLEKNLKRLYRRVELPSYKKVAQIFQEVYLGKKLLKKRPFYWKKEGLVEKEKLIFPKSLLEKIRQKRIRLAVVTGRNRFEAEYALRRFGIFKLFESLVTIDEVRREEKKQGKRLHKPHPWPLLEAARRLEKGQGSRVKKGGGPLRFLYVGDLPDDVLAAKRAQRSIRIQSAAFPKLARDPRATIQEFEKVKPDFFLKTPQDLWRVLFPRRR